MAALATAGLVEVISSLQAVRVIVAIVGVEDDVSAGVVMMAGVDLEKLMDEEVVVHLVILEKVMGVLDVVVCALEDVMCSMGDTLEEVIGGLEEGLERMRH